MKKPKVLYIITDLNYGGAEKQLEILAKRSTSFAEPFVAGLKGWGKTAQSLSQNNIQVWVKNQFNAPQSHYPGGWPGLIQLTQAIKPDIIHTFLFRANVIGRVLSRFSTPRPKVISSVRVWDNRWLPLRIEQLTQNWCDCVVFNSQTVADLYSQTTSLPSSKKRVIENTLELNAEKILKDKSSRARTKKSLGLHENDFMVLGVGRLDEQKGFQYLIEALELVLKNPPKTPYGDIKIAIAGDGPQKKFLETEIKKRHLENQIHLLGFRSDIPELMSACDLFVLPSLWEGSPNTVIEALAAKTPLIATSVGGTPELINYGENGLLVPPGDSNALADAIKQAATNTNNFLNSTRFANFKNVQPPEVILKKYETLYQNLLLNKIP